MSIDVSKYVKMDPIEHILNRPDTYVGSIRSKTTEDYIAKVKAQPDGTLGYVITKEKITYPPALLRVFVEALSNAIDNLQRSKENNIAMRKIEVSINKETGETRVWNDGIVIPIEKNEKEGCYVHTMIFGHLLTSSNYNDNEERLVSGRNGLGIKLTNVFSKSFKVKAVDPVSGKMFQQEWTDNMRVAKEPKITSSSLKNGYTEISWTPDFEKFKMAGYSDDIFNLFTKYVYDAAMLTKLTITLNDTKLPVKTLQDYAKLYESPTAEMTFMKSDNCEVVVTTAKEFEAVSFVNGVFTMNGGMHVDAWSEAVFRPLVDAYNKPNKPQVNVKDVKQYFRIFVVANLVNPEFTSQSKTELAGPNVTTNVEKKNINAMLKWENTKQIEAIIHGKELLVLKKTEAKKKGFTRIEGLDDANKAGTKHSSECTLILCEGLSAKTYAVKGIEHGAFGLSGRDWFGIYPLRGKVLNARKNNVSTIGKNKEITDVIQALGLRYGVDYTDDANFSQLRYGRLLIVTDADTDGKHIKGLIMNFIHHLFPTLLKRTQSFIVDMMTPIARFILTNKEEVAFYDLAKADKYFKEHANNVASVKYYKGLGTSSDAEIEETFGKRVFKFTLDEKADETMNMAFGGDKGLSDKRKEWISAYNCDAISGIDEVNSEQPISAFINEEMIKFSIDDCKRSLPNVMDGLKESQRKILYACFLRNLKYSGTTLKVAQLAGYVAEKTNYHHGEQNLLDTIIKMANEFVGSNNIPLLFRDGQFGTRLQGGKDAASGRYIFTKLEKLTRLLFREEDDVLLDRVIDDGDMVEPKFYIPILPMVLINGSTGIATGWSCNIPFFNPLDVVKAIKTWMEKELFEEPIELIPYYHGFKGKIESAEPGKFVTTGIMENDAKHIIVKELPINEWTDDYKDFLDKLKEEKKIKDYSQYSKANEPHFEISENESMALTTMSLKLTSTLSTTNMVMFSSEGKIKKYSSPSEIIDEFCRVRLSYYRFRKEHILATWKEKASIAKNKIRFLEDVMDDKITLKRREKKDIVKDLIAKKYDKVTKKEDDDEEDSSSGYEYLLRMSILTFTNEKVSLLKNEVKTIEAKIDEIQKTSEKTMWRQDLDEFTAAYQTWLEEMEKAGAKKRPATTTSAPKKAVKKQK